MVGSDFSPHTEEDVPSMWGNVAWGPGWCSEAEREERLFTNRSNQSGDDMKDEVRTDDDFYAWSNWRTSKARLWRLRQPAPRPELVPQRWPCKRVWITLTACWPAVAGRPMQQLYDDNTAHLCSELLAAVHLPGIVTFMVTEQCNGDW